MKAAVRESQDTFTLREVGGCSPIASDERRRRDKRTAGILDALIDNLDLCKHEALDSEDCRQGSSKLRAESNVEVSR